MKVAIVGSDSFLAGYIISELSTDTELHLFGIADDAHPQHSFSKFKFPETPFDMKELLANDAIIYCAGAGIQADLNENRDIIYELNAFQPIKLVNQLIENNYKGKFISFGSYFEIGDSQSEKYFDELEFLASRFDVPNDYCISKRIFSRFIDSISGTIHFLHFILPNIYGKNENSNRLIPSVIQSVQSGKPVTFTAGTQIRQYLHAQDISELVHRCVMNSASGIYNLTMSEPVQVKMLIRYIYEEMQSSHLLNPSQFCQQQRADNKMPFLLLDDSKARNDLNWNPRISLPEGLKSYLI
jgi:nucleoside-diphosphate-sugar epimerase